MRKLDQSFVPKLGFGQSFVPKLGFLVPKLGFGGAEIWTLDPKPGALSMFWN